MNMYSATPTIVIAAKAGIQSGQVSTPKPWIPAFAGMTKEDS